MKNSLQLATFAGGCFWSSEAIFSRIKGVESVIPGYAGGSMENPTYDDVVTGNTGYAEVVQIKFDPSVITFNHLLDIFWATHDPTSLNKQGADVGTQYKSVIFYHNIEQKNLAAASKENLEKSGIYKNKIVTEILPLKKFYTAEQYHKNYYEKNKDKNPYCSVVITPKIQKLLDKFNSDIKEEYHG